MEERFLKILHSQEVKPNTLQLFGMYLAECRGEKSLETFAATLGRTVEWIAAVENGEIQPTPLQLCELGLTYGDDQLDEVLINLDWEPWGDRARALRDRFGVPVVATGGDRSNSSNDTSIVPGIEGISLKDRLLTAGPLLVLVILVAWYWGLSPFSGGGPHLHYPDLQKLLLWMGVGAPMLVLYVDRIDSEFGRITRWFRMRSKCKYFDQVERIRKAEYLSDEYLFYEPSASTTTWMKWEDLRSMPRSFRPTMRRAALILEISERLALVVAIKWILTWVALNIALISSDFDEGNDDLAWAGILLVESLVLCVFLCSAQLGRNPFLALYLVGIGTPDEGPVQSS